MPAKAVAFSGGVAHDFPSLSARLGTLLGELDLSTTVSEDFTEVASLLPDADLLVVNALRWRMLTDRYESQRPAWQYSPVEASRAAVEAFLERGGGIVALHTAVICFDDWPGWAQILGARWKWEQSLHPPAGPARITVYPERHPIVADLPASFEIDDEIYAFLDLADDVVALMTGSAFGTKHPLLWAREVGHGRVVTVTLGHHLPSYESRDLCRIIQRGALWSLRRSHAVIAGW